MADQIYGQDTVKVHDPVKFYLMLGLGIVMVLALLFGMRFMAKQNKAETEPTWVEDSNRKVFREEDIAKDLKRTGGQARQSFLTKLEARKKERYGNSPEQVYERLGPLVIVEHEAPPQQILVEPDLGPQPIGLPLGTKMQVVLKNKIFSFNVESHIEAELVRDVYYLGKLRLAKGTKFFGQVSLRHSEDRVNIHFHRLLLPWGEERSVRAVAHALDGSGGIPGKVHRRWMGKFFSFTGKTALGALTLFTVPNRQEAFSLDNQLRLTAATNLSQEASRELDRIKVDKAITVESHLPFQIILLETL